jgi:hypothetical protein
MDYFKRTLQELDVLSGGLEASLELMKTLKAKLDLLLVLTFASLLY